MMGKTRFCALVMPGFADGPSKYSYIYIDVICVIYDHFCSACGLLGEVDMLSTTHGDWPQETLDKHIASAV
jgi:hypothetical protein